MLFQLGTELVTPTEGEADVPTDGAVTVPTLCPELPIVPCCTGAPGVLCVLLCAPVADVCALAANGDAANPTAISAATKSLVLVMADPFRREASVASAVRSSNRSCTEPPYNATRAKMCHNTIILQVSTLYHNAATEGVRAAAARRRIVPVSRSAPTTKQSRVFYPS